MHTKKVDGGRTHMLHELIQSREGNAIQILAQVGAHLADVPESQLQHLQLKGQLGNIVRVRCI